MRIFVTGGTGFIGTHLVKKLQEKGHNLLLLSFDLAETEKWKKEIQDFNPDAVAHLAWGGLPDYSPEMSRKNIEYSLNLFSFLAEINCKTILSVGSAWEKGGRFPEFGVESTLSIKKPADVFSAAKWIVNLWGTAIVEEKNRQVNTKNKGKFIWARIFFVYGPGQRETSLIPYLINCWKKGENPEIKNPSAKNDFIYIDDVTEAIAVLLEKCQESGEYDIGWGKLISTQEIVNSLAQKLKMESWYGEVKDLKDDNSFYQVADIRKLKEIGWEPKINIEQGLQKMINHYLTK